LKFYVIVGKCPAIVYKYIEGITEAKGNVLTSLCKYWFQTLALPRLEPTNNMCDELAITIYK